MFISVHTPKTAGTAVGEMLNRASGQRIIFDYDDYASPDRPDPAIQIAKDQIEVFFAGVHGHFFRQKYQGLFSEELYITCVRNPIDRVISQYKHETYDALSGSNTWRSSDLASGRMSVVDFVRSDDNVRKAQTVHMGNEGVNGFDFVFITENIDQDCNEFRRLFGNKFKYPDEINVRYVNGSNRRPFDDTEMRMKYDSITRVSNLERSELYLSMPEDIELFEKVKEGKGIGKIASSRSLQRKRRARA